MHHKFKGFLRLGQILRVMGFTVAIGESKNSSGLPPRPGRFFGKALGRLPVTDRYIVQAEVNHLDGIGQIRTRVKFSLGN
jgi:hypothetical protein